MSDDPTAFYTNVAFIRAKPGRSEELGLELGALIPQTRREDTNLAYDLHRSIDDPNVWLVYEIWRTREALDDHFKLPHMKGFMAKAPSLVDGKMDLFGFRPVSAQACEAV